MQTRLPTRPAARSARRHPSGLRLAAWLSAGLTALLLGACGSTVSLNGPPPIVNIPMSPQVQPSPPPAAPQPAPSAAPPEVFAQPLQPTPGIAVQPLGPESAPLPATSQPLPAASAPPASPTVAAPASPASSASPPAAQTLMPPSGPLPANAVRYVCNDGTSFVATFGDVSVTLSTALGVVKLEQTVAADGARYKNGDLQVWFKGRQATINNLTPAGNTTLCVEQR